MTAPVGAEDTGVRACAMVLEHVASCLRAAGPRVSVAFSGGVDSTVLLEAVRRLAGDLGVQELRALHVDHGLEPQAAGWAARCRAWCRERGVAYEALAADAAARSGQSPEEAAREARYAALAAALGPQEALCVAHHADDQAETVLLNLLRGSGVHGVAAMASMRDLPPGKVLRPLLGVRRRDIESCARHWGLDWVEDPANRRSRHPRNRLRHEVLPLLESLSSGAVNSMVRSAELLREAATLVDDLADQDLASCCQGAELSRESLRALPGPRRRSALRRWLALSGVRPLPRARLVELERQLLTSRPDSLPALSLEAAELRVHRDRIALVPVPQRRRVDAGVAGPWAWRPGEPLDLPGGRLWAVPVNGDGLIHDDGLEVRLRAGGERCRPGDRRHSQTLKRLLQERAVPPWARQELPLIYREGVLVAVADLFVCHGHEAGPGQRGWKLCWKPSHGEAGLLSGPFAPSGP